MNNDILSAIEAFKARQLEKGIDLSKKIEMNVSLEGVDGVVDIISSDNISDNQFISSNGAAPQIPTIESTPAVTLTPIQEVAPNITDKGFACDKCAEKFFTSEGLMAHGKRHDLKDTSDNLESVNQASRFQSAANLSDSHISNSQMYLQTVRETELQCNPMSLDEIEQAILASLQRMENEKTIILTQRRIRVDKMDAMSEEEREVRRQYKVEKNNGIKTATVKVSSEKKAKVKGETMLEQAFKSCIAALLKSGLDQADAEATAREMIYGE